MWANSRKRSAEKKEKIKDPMLLFSERVFTAFPVLFSVIFLPAVLLGGTGGG
ncbi:MAG: hypothetical protein LBS68_01050 [Puniceicoccales bacterium]|nr:hypothetical protein [Puniceicoccales bacterium]